MKLNENEKICVRLLITAVIISILFLGYEIFENIKLQKISDIGETTVTIQYYNEKTEVASLNNEKTKYEGKIYVINKETKKIHTLECEYAKKLSSEKKVFVRVDDPEILLKDGYTLCGSCNVKDKK